MNPREFPWVFYFFWKKNGEKIPSYSIIDYNYSKKRSEIFKRGIALEKIYYISDRYHPRFSRAIFSLSDD